MPVRPLQVNLSQEPSSVGARLSRRLEGSPERDRGSSVRTRGSGLISCAHRDPIVMVPQWLRLAEGER